MTDPRPPDEPEHGDEVKSAFDRFEALTKRLLEAKPSGNGDSHADDHVHQAMGMISSQAGCDLSEAFDKLRERATAMGESIEDTALGVLNGATRFDQ